jgi:hypothetical protein
VLDERALILPRLAFAAWFRFQRSPPTSDEDLDGRDELEHEHQREPLDHRISTRRVNTGTNENINKNRLTIPNCCEPMKSMANTNTHRRRT